MRQHGRARDPQPVGDVDSFNYTSNFPALAADKRPVWVIEHGPGTPAKPPVETQEVSQPGGGQTAYVNTWALGALAATAPQTFLWGVVPVKAGTYTVHYSRQRRASPGRRKHGSRAAAQRAGSFAVKIAAAPPTPRRTRRRARSSGTYPAGTPGGAATP